MSYGSVYFSENIVFVHVNTFQSPCLTEKKIHNFSLFINVYVKFGGLLFAKLFY